MGTKLIQNGMRVLAVAGLLSAAVPYVHATTLFSDGSENSTVGAQPGVNDPTVGTWDYTANLSTQILTKTGATASGPGAAATGSNYLKIGRIPLVLGGGVASVGALFDYAVDTTLFDLHAEFDMWNENSFQYQASVIGLLSEHSLFPWTPGTSVLKGPIYVGDRSGNGISGLWYESIVPDAWVYTGNDLNNGQWNAITMDWNAGASTLTIGVNGSSTVVVAAGTATLIDRLQFFPAGSNTEAFYDNILITTNQPIPEPASLVLMGIGAIVLLRRRGVRAMSR